MKFVAYYRVSKPSQADSGLGLNAQRLAVSRYVGSINGDLVGEFEEVETGKKINRAELRQAIALCIRENAHLVFYRIDRLSRDGVRVMADLEEAGVNYIDAHSPSDNKLIKGLKFIIAMDERDKISQRTKEALRAKKLKEPDWQPGKAENFSDAGRKMGNEAMKLKARTNPNNIRAYALAKVLRRTGCNYSQIARELNQAGFLTSRGKHFRPQQAKLLFKTFATSEQRREVA